VNFTEILIALVAAIFAITLHEMAHGWCALALGDDTARKAGRLTLNPLAHVDPFGTIILPGILLIGQLVTMGRVGFMFGWAKPVPVSAWKFRDPRRGMAVVATAGPAMNFLLAYIGALLMPLPSGPFPPGADALDVAAAALGQHPIVAPFLFYFILTNLVLGLFNLLPIPPLDGGRIAVGLLPLSLARRWAQLERAGIVLVVLLVFLLPPLLRQFGIDFNPFNDALDAVVPWAFRVLFYLSGHGVSPAGAVLHV
jgi:Zn-dependent protease